MKNSCLNNEKFIIRVFYILHLCFFVRQIKFAIAARGRIFLECGKFRGSRAIVGLVGLVPSCYRAFVGNSWVQNFFSWVFRGSKSFSRRYLVDLKFFLVGISWI